MNTMLIRRAPRMKLRIDCALSTGTSEKRSAIGMIRWLEIIVDSAIDETITIEVADEKPPRKASSAIAFWSWLSGSVSTNRSGFEPPGSRLSPATAIGMTNRQIRNR
jgi:hypothetical protein